MHISPSHANMDAVEPILKAFLKLTRTERKLLFNHLVEIGDPFDLHDLQQTLIDHNYATFDILSSLPAELALRVLKYLSTKDWACCQLVCRRWLQLACEPALWRDSYIDFCVRRELDAILPSGPNPSWQVEYARTFRRERNWACAEPSYFYRVLRTKGTRTQLKDGHLAVINESNNVVEIYQLQEDGHGNPICRVKMNIKIGCVDFCIKGKLIALGTYIDHSCHLFDMSTGHSIGTLSGGHASTVSLISIDGDLLATGSFDGAIVLWEWKTGKLLKSIQLETNMHDQYISFNLVSRVAFSIHPTAIDIWCLDTLKKLASVKIISTFATFGSKFSTDNQTGRWLYPTQTSIYIFDGRAMLSELREHRALNDTHLILEWNKSAHIKRILWPNRLLKVTLHGRRAVIASADGLQGMYLSINDLSCKTDSSARFLVRPSNPDERPFNNVRLEADEERLVVHFRSEDVRVYGFA